MNMNKNVLEHMDKAAYIILLCIAAVAVLVSMVTGPHRNTNDKIFRIAKAPQLPNQSVLRGFLCL